MASSMKKAICMGSLKSVNESSLLEGYSRNHLKSFFGKAEFIYIKGSSVNYNELVMEDTISTYISGSKREIFMRLEEGVLVPCSRGEYVVKPTPKAFPMLSENEHAMMKLCESVGIKTAQCSVIPFEDGELAFTTKRFNLADKSTDKLFIEDGASICQVIQKNNTSLSYENVLKQMVNRCGGAQAAALTALRMLIFGCIIGNNNMPLNNFSLYRKLSNKSTVYNGFTPAYNMLSIAPYSNFFSNKLSLRILEDDVIKNGYNNKQYNGSYSFEDFYLLAQSLGISAKAAEKLILNFICTIEKKTEALLFNSNLSDSLKELLLSQIMTTCRDLKK